MSETKPITRDPIYYGTVAFFALLTTFLPAIMGQPRFLPILQTIGLTIFVILPLHHRYLRGALQVMAIWLPIQFIVMLLLSRLFTTHLESAFIDGFAFRAAISAWYSGVASYPNGLIVEPVNRLIEVIGVLVGSFVTAGLLGVWFLVRLVNQAAFGTGILLGYATNLLQAFLVIPYWTLLRAAGYAGLIVLLANPLLTYNWSPSYHWQNYRRLILVSLALIVLGFVLELFLADIVVPQALRSVNQP